MISAVSIPTSRSPLNQQPRGLVRFGNTTETPSEKPPQNNNGWVKPPWYKRLWHYRYKLAFVGTALSFPLLPSDYTVKTVPAKTTRPSAPVTVPSESKPVSREAIMLGILVNIMGLLVLLEGVGKHKIKSAYHEIGHFLSAIQVLDDPLIDIEEVKLYGTSGGAMGYIMDNHLSPQKQLLIDKAGESMECLVDGYSSLGNLKDKLDSLVTGSGWLLQHPKEAGQILRFFWNRDDETRQILMRYDRKVVDALAERLVKDTAWDWEQIQDIIEEFRLVVRDKAGDWEKIKDIFREFEVDTDTKSRGEEPRLSDDLK